MNNNNDDRKLNDQDSAEKQKLNQMDYDQDGNTETETKSVSSMKSGGSNPDARYCIESDFLFNFFSQ